MWLAKQRPNQVYLILQMIDMFDTKLAPLDSNYLSVLGQEVELSELWKSKYEEWVEVEVFLKPRDWDQVLQSSTAPLDTKPLEV